MIHDLVNHATESIAQVMRQGHVIAVASSFGKDSSAVNLLAISAAIKVIGEGYAPKIIIAMVDTGIENPDALTYALKEMKKLQAWASAREIDVTCYVARPSMAASFPMRVIGGRALPSFPGTNHDCSTSYKINPARRLRKELLGPLAKAGLEAVTLVGTRFDESEARARRMKNRGDSADAPVRNKEGELVLSPIADWLTDDVWEYLALAGAGEFPSYSDFSDTFRIYADAGGTSCAVVSDAIMSAKPKSGCGARHGCHACTAVASDSSMENFIAGDARYAYMKPLNDIRNFLVNTRWDMSRRLWVGRSIKAGYIAIQPDIYSPSMLRELLRYYLTADRDERIRAAAANEAPRFEVISLATLVGIDAAWSLQAYAKPHTAVVDWLEINHEGKGYYPPKDMPVAIRPIRMPKPRYYYVGDEWDEGLGYERGGMGMMNGLRDPIIELVSGGDNIGGCMGNRTLANGQTVLDVETSEAFDVDEEGAELAIMFMADEMRDRYNKSNGKTGLTAGYRFWVGLGTISLSPQQVAKHDEILRRSAFKERHSLAGADYDLSEILAKCVDEKALPVSVSFDESQEGAVDIESGPVLAWSQIDLFNEMSLAKAA